MSLVRFGASPGRGAQPRPPQASLEPPLGVPGVKAREAKVKRKPAASRGGASGTSNPLLSPPLPRPLS